MSDGHSKKQVYSKYEVRHKRKVSFNPVLRLSQDYREIIREIRQLDSELGEIVLGSLDYVELVNNAFASNIYWSVKLEGNKLNGRCE